MRLVLLCALVVLGCPTALQPPLPTCSVIVDVAPARLEVLVGQQQRLVAAFRNPTDAPIAVSSLSVRGEASFELSMPGEPLVVPSGTCEAPGVLEVPVSFAPRSPGLHDAVLSGQVDDTTFSVPLRGVGVGPRLEANDLSLGLVAIGEAAPRSLVVRNTGTVDTRLDVEVVSIVAASPGSSAAELCVGRWNGASCEPERTTVDRARALAVHLRVTVPGPREWLVTLRSSEFGEPTKVVRLTALVIDTNGCLLAPDARLLEFTPPTETRSLRLANNGATDCLVDSVTTTSASIRLMTVPAPRRRLGPGERLDLTLVGTLGTVDDPLTAELIARLAGAAPPLVVPLQFRVSPVASCLSFGRAELNLGTWRDSCPVGARDFPLQNTCDGPVLLQGVVTTGGVRVAPARGLVAAGAQFTIALTPGPGVGRLSGTAEARGVGGSVSIPVVGEALPRLPRTDTIPLQVAQKVDFLFLLDDSPSFAVHQARTEAALAQFAWRASIDFLDARVGMTSGTRNPGAGRLRTLASGARWTSSRSPAFSADVAALAAMRDGGSEDESCLEAAVRSRTPPLIDELTGTQGFWRPGAFPMLVCVTDADENSDDLDGGIARLGEAMDGGVAYFVVAGAAPGSCSVESPGSRHEPVRRAFNGERTDVCVENWWAAFFGLTGPLLPQTRYHLSSRPDPSVPLTVLLDGVALPPVATDGGRLWSLSSYQHLALDPSLVDGMPHVLTVTYLPACY
ncbi:MAG: hypothetical protein JNJ54_03860 [Myxococcaceae bacterium]|nr:hypothetical protein [Myxococcaceae bacterium]